MRSMAADWPHHVLMTADTVGGVWHHALELAAALAARGARVSLATMGAPLSGAQRAQAAQLPPAVALHASGWRLEWMDEPWQDVRRAGEWLLQLERRLRPDVVHLNQFAFGALPFSAPVLLVAHSCVLSWWRAVHGMPAPPAWDTYRRVVGEGLRGAGLVAAPTGAMLRALAHDYGEPGSAAAPRIVLPNGRSPQCFRPGAKEALILSAGRLWDPAKNMAALQAVAPGLPWPVRLAGAGAAPDGTGAEDPTEDPAALAAQPQRLGELAPAALAREFARAAIYALPARYEPFGQSVLEAGLSRCALVLGDIPSLRESWDGAALFVAPGDPAALRAALLRLIEDPALLQAMGRKALQRARRFTPARMAAAYVAAYRQLTEGAAVAAPGRTRNEEKACIS